MPRLQLDFSLAPAALLHKTLRENAHKSANKTSSATFLARGELDKEEYVRLLMMLWHIYEELEGAFARHSLRMVLQAFSACTTAINRDISHLLQIPESPSSSSSSWRSHPTHTALLASPPPALSAYTSRLRKLADTDRLSSLLVHAFVRHLGDVRGGLTLHDKLADVYGDDGQGVTFLDFRAAEADAGELQRWYDDQLNDVVGDSREQKTSMAKEAVKAFELNCALFAALQTPILVKVDPSLPLIGNPIEESTDVDHDSDAVAQPLAKPGELRKTRETEGGNEVSLASVIAVVIAICLSQLLMVFGGLTGTRGYEKLQTVEQWTRSVWESLTSYNVK